MGRHQPYIDLLLFDGANSIALVLESLRRQGVPAGTSINYFAHEKRGHRVVLAINGKRALSALEKTAYDLVLMDVQMPEMDGLEATEKLREREKSTGKHQPVVAMTALVMKGDRERCIAAGMDGYLSKPIRPQELDEVLDAGALHVAPALAAQRRVVVAPNPSEAAAMLGAADNDEATLASSLSDLLEQPVAVRGAQTIVADDGERWCFDATPSGLGTPGSGDVFVGVLAGLLATGAPPLTALGWAVALHAGAGARLAASTPIGYLARELVDEIPFARDALVGRV